MFLVYIANTEDRQTSFDTKAELMSWIECYFFHRFIDKRFWSDFLCYHLCQDLSIELLNCYITVVVFKH